MPTSLRLALLAAVLLLSPGLARAERIELVLWHSYSGAEQEALNETVAAFNALHKDRVFLTNLPIPNDALADKLTSAIGLGKGPDLFVFAHDRLGDWAAQGIVEPLQGLMTAEVAARFPPSALTGLSVPQKSKNLYGLPLAVKAISLVYDSSKVPNPPTTLEELVEVAKAHTGEGRYGFVFDWGNTYSEAGFLHAFGGGVLDDNGQPTLDSPGNQAAVSWVKGLRDQGLLPKEVSGALVNSLFNDRKAAMIITGPWALRDLKKDIPFKVALLPRGPKAPVSPFASIEGLIVSAKGRHKAEAFEAAKYLTSDEAAKVRLNKAGQPVANLGVWADVKDEALVGFSRQAAQASIPMPSAPAMRHVWTPMDAALSVAFGQGDVQKALTEAQRRVVASVEASGEEGPANTEGPSAQAVELALQQAKSAGLVNLPNARTALVTTSKEEWGTRWCLSQASQAWKQSLKAKGGPCDLLVPREVADLADRALASPRAEVSRGTALDGSPVFRAAVRINQNEVALSEVEAGSPGTNPWLYGAAGLLAVLAGLAFLNRATLAPHLGAYAYIAPACASLVVLIFIPFAYGLSLAFYDVTPTRERFVGMKNFLDIVLLRNAGDAHSFYYTFAMTVVWTLVNVVLHLVVGLGLALILQDPELRFKKVYRVLLIIPWAIPNYITGLIWKAMFNAEYGLVNRVLGLGAFSWFERPFTAFLANLCTNVWLGFPFMMVTALGALQSIPKELYEAADVDGASRLDKFRSVTLPLLKPALFPAVILGTIWTFNLSFNVIYLVSGGAPDGATDILVTQAFRYAFEQYRYGYAAAYATLIFFILLAYTSVTNRIAKATEGAFE